jgi:hypothetical protein
MAAKITYDLYELAARLNAIPEGQWLNVPLYLIEDCLGGKNPFTGEPPLNRLMGNLIGSGFGAWTVVRVRRAGHYIFQHNALGAEPKRVFHDWDRRPFNWDDSGWYREDF